MPVSDPNASSSPARTVKAVFDRSFVPAILVLVVVIVQSSAFHDEQPDLPSIRTASIPAEPPVEAQPAVIQSAGAEKEEPAAPLKGSTSAETAEEAALESAQSHGPITTENPAATTTSYQEPLSHAGHGTQPRGYTGLLEQQSRAYFEAAQARRQHWNRMQAHRVMIQQRMERDREAIIQRMQEIEQERLERPHPRFSRIAPGHNLAGYHPI